MTSMTDMKLSLWCIVAIVLACLEAGVFCKDVFVDAVERNDVEMIRTLEYYVVPYYGEGLKLALEHRKLQTGQIVH